MTGAEKFFDENFSASGLIVIYDQVNRRNPRSVTIASNL